MNVVTTKAKGWQKRCWDFAMAGKGFEVMGVEGKHIHFFQELCGAYDAKYKFSPGKFTLRFPHSSHEGPQGHVQHKHSQPAHTAHGHIQQSHLLRGHSTHGHSAYAYPARANSHAHSSHGHSPHAHSHSTTPHHN